MDEEIRKKILKDYKKAQENVERILEGKPNFFVKSIKQYLDPTIVCEVQSLEDERGELDYYTQIRNKLEIILAGGKPAISWHFNGAPEEITNYLDLSY